MKEIIIDGTKYDSIKGIHQMLGKEFDWPYYGKNLDALWNVITTDGPFLVKWINIEESKKRIGFDCLKMIKVFQEAEEEWIKTFPDTERFTFIME